jgi:hypothetical protein
MSDESPTLLAVQSVAYAGLDTLLAAVPLELCAYLHVGEQLGPQLYLRRPMLAELDPATAFRLFSTLRDLLDETSDEDAPRYIEGFEACVTMSTGPQSRGLWVAGRRDGLDEEQAALVGELGRGIMAVCHLAETATGGATPANVVRVSVDSSDRGAEAEVAIDRQGSVVTGVGTSPTPLAAVAWATIHALDPSVKLVAADEDDIGETRVVLVLLRNDDGRHAVGSSIADAGSLRGAADATVNALAALRS